MPTTRTKPHTTETITMPFMLSLIALLALCCPLTAQDGSADLMGFPEELQGIWCSVSASTDKGVTLIEENGVHIGRAGAVTFRRATGEVLRIQRIVSETSQDGASAVMIKFEGNPTIWAVTNYDGSFLLQVFENIGGKHREAMRCVFYVTR
jgi:hypothetical protein